MKKHRRVGNATSTNFFTSQFKLKSTEFPQKSRQRKINTTFSNFRHHLFQQQPKNHSRYSSKEGKPVIEQLKFLTSKQDDFKLPQSITKRSQSKTKEQNRLKIEIKNNQLYNQHFQEVPVNKQEADKKTPYYQFAAAKRMKNTSTQNSLRQKLERTALQKYNEAILKENEENQNVVSQKNAQSLYLLLKTARMNQLKQQKQKLQSLPSENQGQQHQIYQKDNENDERKKNNSRKQSQNNSEVQSESNKSKNLKDVRKSKQNLFKQVQQKRVTSTKEPQQKPDIPKPRLPPAQSESFKTEVIQFKKVICDESERQKFTSSEQDAESDFGQQLKEESMITYKKNSNSPTQQNLTQTNIPKEYPTKKVIQHQETRKQPQKVQQNTRKSMQSDDQKQSVKNKMIPQPKKADQKQKKYQQSDLDNIPSGQTYEKTVQTAKQQRKDSSQFISLNNNQIQKVLTTKHLEQAPVKTAPKINPPPKLSTQAQVKANPYKPPQKHAVDDDELQQIDIGKGKNIKKQVELPKQKKQAPQAPPAKPVQPKKESTNAVSTKAVQAPSQPKQKQQQNQEEDESQEGGIENELTYFIERIEDVGQYRINSKDVYNDKSIDKELIQIHKICAYYMAHQFLYLAQWTCNYFKGDNYHNDFYTITSEELKQLKEMGVLDGEIENLEQNIESSKKLLKKCYEQCKPYLKKQQQILLIDGKTNYHIRCCAFLIKEFKKVYELLQKAPKNTVMIQRCVYLIEMYCVMKLLNGEELKEYQEFQDIQNPIHHIETYKKLLLSI